MACGCKGSTPNQNQARGTGRVVRAQEKPQQQGVRQGQAGTVWSGPRRKA
jgi:hypothetical protein